MTSSFTFDGVVRVTRIGTTYLIFTVLIGFAALNTGNNALYIGLTFMLGCLLLSGMASKGGLKHMQVELTGIEDAWAGQPAHGLLRIGNDSRIWNVRDVVITSDELAEPLLVPMVTRGTVVEVPATFGFSRRGVVTLNHVDLYTRYPFGFFLKKRRVRINGEVVVYPRLLGDDAARDRFRPAVGELAASQKPGYGSELHSFRDFVRGDSVRNVAWKKSASLGRWITRQNESDATRVVHVVVDPFKPHGSTDEQFEQLVSAAATFLFHTSRRGVDVMLSLPRMTLRAKQREDASPMFRALALIEPIYEPVELEADETTILFSLRRADDDAERPVA